jgi:hypothetical protein
MRVHQSKKKVVALLPVLNWARSCQTQVNNSLSRARERARSSSSPSSSSSPTITYLMLYTLLANRKGSFKNSHVISYVQYEVRKPPSNRLSFQFATALQVYCSVVVEDLSLLGKNERPCESENGEKCYPFLVGNSFPCVRPLCLVTSAVVTRSRGICSESLRHAASHCLRL